MIYNKLVRDRIPEIIQKKGGNAKIHIADETEYNQKLRDKLMEEVQEFLSANNEEELADVLEVLEAICESFNMKRVGDLKIMKIRENGKFQKRIILEEA